MIRHRVIYSIGVILVVVLVISIGFYGYTKYHYQFSNKNTTNQTSGGDTITMTVLKKNYVAAQDIQNAGDYSGALTAFQTLLQDAPDKASAGLIKIFIGANLFARNQGDDQAKSIQTYKEVLKDPEMPAYVRAKVLTDLAGIVNVKDEYFYKTYFNEQPFSDFLPASGTSSSKMSAVYLRMLQFSDETFPNSYAEYLIAGSYYTPLLVNNLLGTTTPAQIATIIQAYIKRADALAPTDESSYKPSIILERYYYRATALNSSSKILNNVSLSEREDAYKLVLSKGAPYENSSDYPAVTVLMKTRFYYANFIQGFFGKDRNPEVVTLLKPFGKAASSSDPSFKQIRAQYANISSLPDTNRNKTIAVILAKISPEFKEFLASVGFNI